MATSKQGSSNAASPAQAAGSPMQGARTGSPQAPRRRRTPDEARAEILAAAGALLEAGGPSALTVSAVMAATTLSRKSFYVYFKDPAELVVALVRPLRVDADAALKRWRDADDRVAAGRAALLVAAHVYRKHGQLLRAVLQAPSDDPDLLAARADLTASLVTVAEAQIAHFGSSLPDAPAAATALATMNIHTLLDQAPGATDAELARIVDTLSVIWERTLLPAGDASAPR